MAVSVNSERYVATLQDLCTPYLEKNDKDTENIWFPPGVCATAHTTWISMDLVRSTLPGRLVSRNDDVSPKSSDLTRCDFFLYEVSKVKDLCKQLTNLFRFSRRNEK